MLRRLIKGKSTFSVDEWEKSHQARKKLLKRFGVHPYVLNQRHETLDVDKPYLGKGGVWQSSTRIGQEDNMDKYNFPLGINYPSQLSSGMSTDNPISVPIHADVSGDWNENRVGSSPVDIQNRDDIVTRSLFLGNS